MAELYSRSIKPLFGGYSITPMFYTNKTPTKSGADVAERIWDTARYKISLRYRLSESDASTILNFHDAHYGSHTAFDFADFHVRYWEDVVFGTGDGATYTFDLPCTDLAPVSFGIWEDGVAVGASNYSLSDDTGTNGRDEVTFISGHAPADGAILTCNFYGVRFWSVRFERDDLPYRLVEGWRSTYGGADVELEVDLISQR